MGMSRGLTISAEGMRHACTQKTLNYGIHGKQLRFPFNNAFALLLWCQIGVSTVYTVSTTQINFLIFLEAADSNFYIRKCFQIYQFLTYI